MQVAKHKPIEAPFAWKGADLRHRTDWIRPFRPAELKELDTALQSVKRRGLREYGRVATAYVRGFDAKWLRGGSPPGESLLGSADIQSLNDLAGSFDIIRRMRVVPFGPALVIILIVATLAPMAPLLFLAFSLEQVLALAAKLVLGI